MSNKIFTIYVSLLDEGLEVWKPVQAKIIESNVFKIISINEDPEGEIWEFKTGDIVRCEEKKLGRDTVSSLVAIEKVK